MWIIPKNLPTYHSVLATKGLVEDCEEFSQMSEKSLMWRSKPSQSQTWSRRWKRVSYIQRLSTQTLKPSHSKNFVTEYLSYQQASPVSRSRLLARDLPQKIRDTFTPLSQEESQSADQLMLFSKMSKELSQAKQPMGSRYSSMSSEIWKKEVIRLRGEYSLRLKLALHTSGRESLSWPTATSSDGEGGRIETILNKGGFKSKRKTSGQIRGAKLRDAVETYEEKNWRTPTAEGEAGQRGLGKATCKELREKGRTISLTRQVRDSENEKNWATPQLMDFRSDVRKPEERSEKANKGGCSNLREQVHNWKTDKEKKNWSEESSKGWPTASARDWKDTIGMSKTRKDRKGLGRIDQLARAVYHDHGQQDQDKSNIDGKSQESWGTPQASDYIEGSRTNPKSNQKCLGRDLKRLKQSMANAPTIKNMESGNPLKTATGPIKGAKLNPNWVEQLMGLPVGWTQLPIEWID